jgi:stringent starvation protein B
MTSSRPYLIRALYEWITDNNLTPYIVLNANDPNLIAPQQYVSDGKIVLNISAIAIHGLALGNEAIEFKARFSGKINHIYAPIPSVLAIYAKENGQGMVFNEEDTAGTGGDGDQHPPPSGSTQGPVGTKESGKTKPRLTLIKK